MLFWVWARQTLEATTSRSVAGKGLNLRIYIIEVLPGRRLSGRLSALDGRVQPFIFIVMPREETFRSWKLHSLSGSVGSAKGKGILRLRKPIQRANRLAALRMTRLGGGMD